MPAFHSMRSLVIFLTRRHPRPNDIIHFSGFPQCERSFVLKRVPDWRPRGRSSSIDADGASLLKRILCECELIFQTALHEVRSAARFRSSVEACEYRMNGAAGGDCANGKARMGSWL